ncbi:hypothetical protein KY330_05110 [Candidatus Woesearchaeota archaeon]|nr:hypothetical protein [Candidatus Woesearchaeota archaeon]
MGGCYTSYSAPRKVAKPKPKYQNLLNKFKKTKSIEHLINAHKEYVSEKGAGFFRELAKLRGIDNDIPKEFPEIEYEVKFDIQLIEGSGKEPEIADYLNTFDFPATKAARFIKDPVSNIATGTNSFIGRGLEERLVVIEKCGGLYLKEKGSILPVDVGVDYQDIIVKRTEVRYPVSAQEMIEKSSDILKESGVELKGRIRKEKGDDFILDTNDGRLYSFTINRSHLTKAGQKKETAIQRQLELEYAGFIPGFSGFKKNSEKQIVQGMVDLARFVYNLYNNAPIKRNWRMQLRVTNERKYDFVAGNNVQEPEKLEQVLLLPA